MARKSRKNVMLQENTALPDKEKKVLFKAGLYARLSHEKEENIERGTIETKMELMKNYVKDHGDIVIEEEYYDASFTGTNFERPDFQRMLEDAKTGRINCIIVKDLSRLEKKVKSLSSKKMMLYSDYKDDKLTREEYVKRSKAMVEQIDELHQKIEQLKSELPTEDNSAGKFETQLENIINMESFDREKIQKVIKKVIINGEDNIEIVWNTDDPFFK